MKKCCLCGVDTEIVENEPYHYDESGLDVALFGITQYRCPDCGESYAAIPGLRKLNRFIGLHICKDRKALLKPDEIRFLRKDLGLKSKELARVLGVSPSTLSRWENGKKEIGEAYDRLLRSIYISSAFERSDLLICDGLINLFKEIPAKRNKITQPNAISLTPSEWLNNADEACFA
ncbi:conserved hypothetical protein [Candidatus Desulfarcum epimagneticum]|uniref:HTH cro/C1-type domain-containing protein n=1 Tax=uncultured Desulfobacteraceae bacterium TaxID=218296 RepID=A0A484HFX7_9BACT|nr:conserved hypothetical protein [uncultured Desulfobacteraceae bacterium]